MIEIGLDRKLLNYSLGQINSVPVENGTGNTKIDQALASMV